MSARSARSARSRRTLAVASALALSLGLAACSSSSSAGAGDGKSFTYWSMWKVGEPQQKVIAKAITDYEKKTGVKVNVQWQGRDNLKRLVPALNTNNVPDLVDGSFVSGYPTLVATNQALGLKTAWDADVDGKPASSYVPEKYLKNINIKLPDGQAWMLPYQIQSDAIWYNGATHPEITANPPKTWAEFMKTLDAMKAKGEAPIAADGDIGGYNSAWLTTLIVREGGPGSFKKIAEDPTGQAWKSPEALNAAKKIAQLAKGGYFINGYGASKFPYQQQKFATNKAATIFMGTWLPTEAGSYSAPGFEYKSFPFPTLNDSHDSQRIDFSGFMVPKKASQPDAAQKFAAFFLSKTYQDAWGKDAKGIPLRADAATSPELAGVQASIKAASSFHQGGDGEAFPAYNEKMFFPNDDALFLGKSTPQQFVDAMAKDQASYWKANGK